MCPYCFQCLTEFNGMEVARFCPVASEPLSLLPVYCSCTDGQWAACANGSLRAMRWGQAIPGPAGLETGPHSSITGAGSKDARGLTWGPGLWAGLGEAWGAEMGLWAVGRSREALKVWEGTDRAVGTLTIMMLRLCSRSLTVLLYTHLKIVSCF